MTLNQAMSIRLEIAKGIICGNIGNADAGIFDSRNTAGDRMKTIYNNPMLLMKIDICYEYGYFEVFGLLPEEFSALRKYYYSIVRRERQ